MEQHDFDFSNMKDHDANHNAIDHPENSAEYASLTVNKGVAQPPMTNPYLKFKARPRRRNITAAEYVEGLGCADILDFNMGCPAPKVVKNHEGSAMLKNPENAYRVLKALVAAVDMPVTVKMRIGWDDQHINIMEMAQLAQEAGVAAIAIHGRTREQFYRDQADWGIIGKVRASLRIPVIANGDVRNVQDLAKIRQVTGCEAVMVGRAAQGNPWIFRQLTEYLKTGAVLPGPTIEERKEVIIRHLDMLLKFKGDYIGPREMRKHATWYTKGIKGSAELRCLFNQAVCRDDFLRILDKMK